MNSFNVIPIEWQILTQEEKTLLRTLVAMSAVQLDRGYIKSLHDEVCYNVDIVIGSYNKLKEEKEPSLDLDKLKTMLLKGGLVSRCVLETERGFLSTSWIKEFFLTEEELVYELGSNVPDIEDFKE